MITWRPDCAFYNREISSGSSEWVRSPWVYCQLINECALLSSPLHITHRLLILLIRCTSYISYIFIPARAWYNDFRWFDGFENVEAHRWTSLNTRLDQGMNRSPPRNGRPKRSGKEFMYQRTMPWYPQNQESALSDIQRLRLLLALVRITFHQHNLPRKRG